MRIFLNTTIDIKDNVKEAEKFLKRLGIQFDTNRIAFDESNPLFYETTKSWDWLKLKETKSINNKVIKALGLSYKSPNVNYDAYGLVVDKNKAIEDTSLYGQYGDDHKTIEIYAKNTKKKYWGFPYTTYNLIHETLHAYCDYKGIKDTLHEYLKENKTLDKYIDSITKPTKLLPLIERQANELISLAKLIGLDLRITSGYRSFEEQDKLYAQGRTTKGNIVTNAKGGESLHNYGVAFDVVDRKKGYNLTNQEWFLLGWVWKYKTKGEWGGDWKSFVDKPHFQNTLNYSLKDFQQDKVDYTKFI